MPYLISACVLYHMDGFRALTPAIGSFRLRFTVPRNLIAKTRGRLLNRSSGRMMYLTLTKTTHASTEREISVLDAAGFRG